MGNLKVFFFIPLMMCIGALIQKISQRINLEWIMAVVGRSKIFIMRIIKADILTDFDIFFITFRLGDSVASTIPTVTVVLVYITHVNYVKSK